MIEKTAVLAPGCTHAAHRTAVDAGGRDAGEKAAVKTRVPRLQGQVAGIVSAACVGGRHANNDKPARVMDWPFSDMTLERTAPTIRAEQHILIGQ
jgi:hypothetical protein